MPSWSENREEFIQDRLANLRDLKLRETCLKGYDVQEAVGFVGQAEQALDGGDMNQALRFVSQANHALRTARYVGHPGFQEPADYPSILEACAPNKTPLPSYDMSDYEDKVKGGWLGKCIGGAFGAPIEGWSYKRIGKEYGELNDYITEPDTVNDDTAYEILFLHALEKYGPELTSAQLALEWVAHIPRAYTAERVAIDNLIAGYMPPESGTHDNPYSEWIGGQMKGEVPGLVAPGHPRIATYYGYLDGIIAHERNGVYGELYDAVLISLAFVEKDPQRLLQLALEYVPQKSRLHKVVTETIAIANESGDWRQAREKVAQTWMCEYHRVHTFPNLAWVILGMLYGKGDFEHSMCITNMCGMDTDCTAGQVAAILGVMLGAKAIPSKWKDPVQDRFDSYVIGFEHGKVSEVSKLTCKWGVRILRARE